MRRVLLTVALWLALPALAVAQTAFVLAWGGFGSAPGQFHSPKGVDVADGLVYVVDQGENDRVQVFDVDGGPVMVLGGPGTFVDPAGVAVADDGTIYVSDRHRVQAFDASGVFLTLWGGFGAAPGEFDTPAGLAIDALGRVWVADSGNDRLQVFDAAGALVGVVGGPGVAPGLFMGPQDVAFAPDGTMAVADTLNQRVQVFDAAGAYLASWGSLGSGDGQFKFPGSVAFDANGDVLVSDTENHRVQRFDTAGALLEQWGGLGSGDGSFRFATGIDADAAGRIFVGDRENWRMQRFQSPDVPDPGEDPGEEPGEDPPAGATVADIQDAVAALIAGGELHPNRATPMGQLLAQAGRSLERGNTAAARGQLGAFVNQVEALVRSRRLGSEPAAALIALVDAVVAQLDV